MVDDALLLRSAAEFCAESLDEPRAFDGSSAGTTCSSGVRAELEASTDGSATADANLKVQQRPSLEASTNGSATA